MGPSEIKVIGEPRRQLILKFVWDQERSAGEIAAHLNDITFGAVSQHLKVLENAGFVSVRRQGKSRLYQANQANLGPLGTYLQAIWGNHLVALKAAAEVRARNRASGRQRARKKTTKKLS